MFRQEIFSLSSFDKDLKDDFIISKSNREAYHIIQNFPKIWGCKPYEKILLIKGKPSSGKTYLGKIWANLHNAKFIDTSRTLDIDFIHSYECFIIDNLEKNISENNVLHYFNIINEVKKYLLLLTTNHQILLKDLDSRIKSIKIIEIFPPDIDALKFLIKKKFYYNFVSVKDEVIDYLVKILPRDYKYILNFIEKINQLALIKSRKITIPFIKDIYQLIKSS